MFGGSVVEHARSSKALEDKDANARRILRSHVKDGKDGIAQTLHFGD